MEHRDDIVLRKIISEIEVATSIVAQCDFESFNENEMMKRATCMTVINIGELVKNLSEDIRQLHKNIPWKAIAGFRDIAAHKYQTLRMEDVYETVTADFPDLHEKLQNIL